METYSPEEAEIIEEFALFEDWMDKYDHIISMGIALPPMPEHLKTDENIVRGCQSRVWVFITEENGILHIQADADALIAKGIVALLVRVYSGQPATLVAERAENPAFIDAIGLREHLSPTRSNGLASMVQRIREQARSFIPKV